MQMTLIVRSAMVSLSQCERDRTGDFDSDPPQRDVDEPPLREGYGLGEFASDGATMSFQLCGGVFSSPCRPMKPANASMPWTGLPNSSLSSLTMASTAAVSSVRDGSCVR